MKSLGMVVLQPGVDHKKTWRLKVTCDGKGMKATNDSRGNVPCGALLSINMNDVFTDFSFTYTNNKTYQYLIKCPCCKCITELSPDKVPNFVKYVAKSKTEFAYDEQVKKEKDKNPNYERDLYKKEDEPESEGNKGNSYIELE